MSEFGSSLHQNTAEYGKLNRKYVSFDGYFEAVYSYDNRLINEIKGSLDMGTVNYSPSTEGVGIKGKILAGINHFKNDMLPYWLYRNTEKDKDEETKKPLLILSNGLNYFILYRSFQ